MSLALVLGGIRSGKSAHAVRLAAEAGGRVAVVATGAAGDPEMAERIAAHRRSRPADWTVHEEPRQVSRAVPRGSADTVLLESVDGLVATLGDPEACVTEVTTLVHLFPRVVAVSSEVGMSLVALTAAGRDFSDALGIVNQRLAALADRVVLVVAGLPIALKVT
jgi:adenosyl cobinamide kinase/adenosyl cobinamide phosphate guanylyltransferase